MTNREKLNQYTDHEFAEYIQAVFWAGRLYEQQKGMDMINYEKWLGEDNAL